MLFLGFQGCNKTSWNLSLKYSKNKSCIAYVSSNQEKTFNEGITLLEDDGSHLLGMVSYCRRDHHLGLIQIDSANQCSKINFQKMGLIFYASKSLKDCVDVRLSNKEVTLSYLDGGSEVLSVFIEVQGKWMNGLSKETKPLFHEDSCSKLAATYSNDFTLLTALYYGIESFHDINRIVLLEGQDKTIFEDINHAGFMVKSRMPTSTSELVQLVRHLSIGTLQSTSAICSDSVRGNRLQPVEAASDDVSYSYIKSGNRYLLISFSGGTSSGKEYQGSGAMCSVGIRQVVTLGPENKGQEEVVVKSQVSNMAVQTEHSLYNNYVNHSFEDECSGLD